MKISEIRTGQQFCVNFNDFLYVRLNEIYDTDEFCAVFELNGFRGISFIDKYEEAII